MGGGGKNNFKMEPARLTEGQRRVRINFNVSGNKDVDELKTLAAAFIDKCDELSKRVSAGPENAQFLRELATAMTDAHKACSMAVGAVFLI